MNCKPGDLAVVVRDLEEPRNIGALVLVVARAIPKEWVGPADWECEAVSTVRYKSRTWSHGEGGFAFCDHELRPIRDPGADAVDQTLSWLDVPSKQGEPA